MLNNVGSTDTTMRDTADVFGLYRETCTISATLYLGYIPC
jgi:hypothetical protein